MNRTDFLTFVTAAGVLDEHRSEDVCLDKLINVASESPSVWQTHADISISPPDSPASQFEPIFRRRLAGIPDEPGTEPLRMATERFVDYCVAHPDAVIWEVTFNCPERSYSVCYGQVGERMDFIWVVVGKHIPGYAMRR